MARLWEEPALRPWETQQPLYPRTVAITRPNILPGVGAQAYSAITEPNESEIASGLPASIQQKRFRGTPESGIPSAAPDRSQWVVFIPSTFASLGLTTERDIITDDLGKRYVVIAAYWDSLGYSIECELLEA